MLRDLRRKVRARRLAAREARASQPAAGSTQAAPSGVEPGEASPDRSGSAAAAADLTQAWRAAVEAAGSFPQPPPYPPHTQQVADALARCAAVAPALAQQLAALDPWQLDAVLSPAPSAVVEAQVGSGKTTVLVHKIVYEHVVHGTPLRQMAVLTFTNKAAGEFRARVSQLLSDAGYPPPDAGALRWFGTFHALARTLLVHDLPVASLGYTTAFQVQDASERALLWQRLILGHGLTVKHQRRLERRMALLQEGQTRFGNMRKDDDLLRLAELASAERRTRNVMDFDELLANAHALLVDHPLADPPAWVVVDELQDCDLDQLDLVDALAAPTTRRLYVGDPNQVIYGWRGSAPRLFDHVRTTYGAETLRLPVNYRSTATIVEGARVFLHASGRMDAVAARTAELVAHRPAGVPVRAMALHDPRAESAWVAAELRALHERGVPWREMAVLARTRARLAPVRAALVDAGVPVAMDSASRQAHAPLSRWLLHLVRAGLVGDVHSAVLALTDRDWGALRPKDGTEMVVADAADMAGVSHESDESDAADGPDAEAAQVATGLSSLQRWLLGRAGKRRRKGEDLALASDVFAGLLGLRARVNAGADAAELSRTLLLPALLGPTKPGYGERVALAEAWLASLLALCRGPDRAEALTAALSAASVADEGLETHVEGVHVATMHAAKGLEWDVVWVVGCNHGALPLPAALRDPAQLNEERRLFFVAMTRARDVLALSWCRAPDDPRATGDASAFLRLLPRDLVELSEHPVSLSAGAPEAPARARPASDDATGAASRAGAASSGAGAPGPLDPATSAATQAVESAAVESAAMESAAVASAAVESAAVASAAVEASQDAHGASAWQVGDACVHPRYGEGAVVQVDGSTLVCDFGKRGTRSFAARMNPLKRPG